MSNFFGERIRHLREEKNLLLRQIAPLLDIDTPQLSKIERGERQMRKEAIPIISKALNTDEEELTTLWLEDQIENVIHGEPMAENALKSLARKIVKKQIN